MSLDQEWASARSNATSIRTESVACGKTKVAAVDRNPPCSDYKVKPGPSIPSATMPGSSPAGHETGASPSRDSDRHRLHEYFDKDRFAIGCGMWTPSDKWRTQ